MLYLLGGASRSGKTMLARKAVAEKAIPYFPLDAIFGGLVNGAPEFGVTYEDSLFDRPIKMWPITKPLLNFFFEEEKDFLIEGDTILPSQIHELVLAGKPIKCCFVGYTELSTEEKFSLVRKYHQGEIDWTKEISDKQMMAMIEEMIRFSAYLKEECEKYGFEYFDVSHDFETAHSAVFEYLLGNK